MGQKTNKQGRIRYTLLFSIPLLFAVPVQGEKVIILSENFNTAASGSIASPSSTQIPYLTSFPTKTNAYQAGGSVKLGKGIYEQEKEGDDNG